MTKKELLEMEAFKVLPDDAEIIFNTSEKHSARVPLTDEMCWYERRCTNLDDIQKAPKGIRGSIKQKYGCFLVIDAMPIGYMRDKLHITFDL